MSRPSARSLTPVLFELGGSLEDWRLGVDDFQFGATGRTVNDLSDFQIVVQGYLGPTLDAFGHCVRTWEPGSLKAFELNSKIILSALHSNGP